MKNEQSLNEALIKTDVMQSVLKETDCRYGNYIIYGGSITQLNEKEMCHFFRFPEAYKPIQLTEEWLLKFGFEKEFGVFKLKGLKCWFTKYTSEPNLYSVNIGNIKLSTLKYVHELQNLYFALTGSELTVA